MDILVAGHQQIIQEWWETIQPQMNCLISPFVIGVNMAIFVYQTNSYKLLIFNTCIGLQGLPFFAFIAFVRFLRSLRLCVCAFVAFVAFIAFANWLRWR